MKKAQFVSAIALLCLTMAGAGAWAQEGAATKEECVAKVTEVADRIKAEGFEAVAPMIKPGGPYVWGSDGYVFCMDTKEGIMLAHPFFPPQLMNRSLLGMTDGNGKPFMKEMLETANGNGKGWVSYLARRRGFTEPQLKEAYVLKVPEAEVIVGAGYFPEKK